MGTARWFDRCATLASGPGSGNNAHTVRAGGQQRVNKPAGYASNSASQ